MARADAQGRDETFFEEEGVVVRATELQLESKSVPITARIRCGVDRDPGDSIFPKVDMVVTALVVVVIAGYLIPGVGVPGYVFIPAVLALPALQLYKMRFPLALRLQEPLESPVFVLDGRDREFLGRVQGAVREAAKRGATPDG